MNSFAKALLLLAALGLSGCSTVGKYLTKNSLTDPPSSSSTYEQAVTRARSLVITDPSLRLIQVSDTGSMKPFLGENSILVMEPVKSGSLAKGQLASFVAQGGNEKVHIIVGFTRDGQVLLRGANSNKTERAPRSAITGRMTAAFWFDKTSLDSPSTGKLPIAYANNSATVPAGLAILRAQMITSGPTARIASLTGGEYGVVLERNAALRLNVGAPGANWEHASAIDLQWEENRSGSKRRISVFDESNPGLGTIMLTVDYR